MDDLTQQLNQILSDPQSMQQIQGILGSLGMNGGGGGSGAPAAAPPAPAQAPAPQSAPTPASSGGGFDMSALSGALSSLGGLGGLGSLLGNGGGQAASTPASAPAPVQNPLGALGALGGLGGLGGGGSPLGGVTPEMLNMVTKLGPLLSQVNQEDDATRLLHALRPLLSEARQKKVDEAMKILQMMRLLPLLKESGVFSGLLSGLL